MAVLAITPKKSIFSNHKVVATRTARTKFMALKKVKIFETTISFVVL